MVQRTALLVGGLGAAAVLAFALGLGNFVFAQGDAKLGADQPTSASLSADASTPATDSPGAQDQAQTRVVVDKVYIAPAPLPNTAAPSAPPVDVSTAAHGDAGRDTDDEERSQHSTNTAGEGGDD